MGLVTNAPMRDEVEAQVKVAIASEAEHGIPPSSVLVALSPGSVRVECTIPAIGLGDGVVDEVQRILFSSTTLGERVATNVGAVMGIDAITTGDIVVSQISKPGSPRPACGHIFQAFWTAAPYVAYTLAGAFMLGMLAYVPYLCFECCRKRDGYVLCALEENCRSCRDMSCKEDIVALKNTPSLDELGRAAVGIDEVQAFEEPVSAIAAAPKAACGIDSLSSRQV